MDSKLNEAQELILDRMYFHGRGYTTVKITKLFYNFSEWYITKLFHNLSEKNFVKIYDHRAIKNNTKIYVLTSKAIDFLNEGVNINYLKRFRRRNEDIKLVIEKLKMKAFSAQIFQKNDSVIFIANYQKVDFYKNKFGFKNDDFKSFFVRGSENIFFNDVQYYFESQKLTEIYFAVFPRAEIKERTFLKDFLIRQYSHLNCKLRLKNIVPKFQIVCSNPMSKQEFENIIKNQKCLKQFLGSELTLEDVYFYFQNKTLSTYEIGLNYFDVEALYSAPPVSI